MKVKIIQADTRSPKLYLESRNLNYGPPNQMNFELIQSLNNNCLLQPRDPLSIGRVINLIKAKHMGMEYECVYDSHDNWESGGPKAVPWIKIFALMNQMKDPKNKDIDIFCFIDTDAWIRDEKLFVEFCTSFMNDPEHLAIPRDIEFNNTSYFNSGFIAVKHTDVGFSILDTIYNHPDYRALDQLVWHEQSQLSTYHTKYPGTIKVLPMNDFNTPCGRIVRHCWTKHLLEDFVIEEALGLLTKIGLSYIDDTHYSLGPEIYLFSSSSFLDDFASIIELFSSAPFISS
jgi:hypothetical protein